MALSADSLRVYESGIDPITNTLPVVASDIVYIGSALGDNGSGYARPLTAGDPFLGFAEDHQDNSAGSAGDLDVKVRSQGVVKLAVTGVTGVGDVGEPVYASDDGTFTLTASTNTLVGTVQRHVSGTTCMVTFASSTLQRKAAAVADLNQTISATYDQAEVQAISDKVDALLASLRTAGTLDS